MPRKSHKNKKYSKELKQSAVQDYLEGKGSLICKKHSISDKEILRDWIKCYNGNIEFKERSASTGEIYLTFLMIHYVVYFGAA